MRRKGQRHNQRKKYEHKNMMPKDAEKGPLPRPDYRDASGKRIRTRGRFKNIEARIARRNTNLAKKKLNRIV